MRLCQRIGCENGLKPARGDVRYCSPACEREAKVGARRFATATKARVLQQSHARGSALTNLLTATDQDTPVRPRRRGEHPERDNGGFKRLETPIQGEVYLTETAKRIAAIEKVEQDLARRSKRYKDGERRIDKDGYVVVRVDGKLIKEHRLVLERKLGRQLERGESAHHINGIRHDNRPENLELWVGPIRPGVRAAELTCPHCGTHLHISDLHGRTA